MGRVTVQLTVSASVSDHNSDQDVLDRQAWARLVRQVRELAARVEEQGHLDAVEVGGDTDVGAEPPAARVLPFRRAPARLRLVERRHPDGWYERDHLT